jgi:NifU-like protein
MEQDTMGAAADAGLTGDFETMTLVQKIKAIDAVVDENVRQFLIMDGGNMEIIDVKDSENNIDVYIRYLGACSSCSSSTTGTLFAIEAALKEKLSDKIRVLPI